MDLNEVKIGDRIESYTKGWGTVTNVDTIFFIARFDPTKETLSYYKNGKFQDTDLHPEIINWEPVEQNIKQLTLNKMKTAPKNKHVLLIWKTPYASNRSFNIREGYWEDFSFGRKKKPKAYTPVWRYVDDNMTIRNVAPIGWLPLPELTNK